ncbi:MAG: metalloregulator ArsR/SmtB family transcription factor [candidate division Zixibacteria bacterium]|nr:metalloregulator ArsR/SmtB family transcription factor [candidate division Zixibacteria bacterium]
MIKDKAKFFKALGDETRLKIVKCALGCECCACGFVPKTKKDQTTVSRHLKILVEAGILKYQKKGRFIIYRIKSDELKKFLVNLGLKEITRTSFQEDK